MSSPAAFTHQSDREAKRGKGCPEASIPDDEVVPDGATYP